MRQDGSVSGKKKKEGQRTLEREVSDALRLRKGPVRWDVLCAPFEGQPAVYSIASMLNELKEGCFIAVDKEQNVTITPLGFEHKSWRTISALAIHEARG